MNEVELMAIESDFTRATRKAMARQRAVTRGTRKAMSRHRRDLKWILRDHGRLAAIRAARSWGLEFLTARDYVDSLQRDMARDWN